MKLRLLWAIVLAALFYLPSSQANIGPTLRRSQVAYHSRGTPGGDGTVTWNYNGWKITERYGSDGYCTNVIYEAGTIVESDILDLLRANTPRGVFWEEQFNTGMSAVWNSTQFVSNGFACHMRATFRGAMIPVDPDSTIKPTLGRLSIQVVP